MGNYSHCSMYHILFTFNINMPFLFQPQFLFPSWFCSERTIYLLKCPGMFNLSSYPLHFTKTNISKLLPHHILLCIPS